MKKSGKHRALRRLMASGVSLAMLCSSSSSFLIFAEEADGLNANEMSEMTETVVDGETAPEENPAVPAADLNQNKFKVGDQSGLTLQQAFDLSKQNPNKVTVIELTDNLTLTSGARCTGTRINAILTSGEGGPYTITRADSFASVSDNHRSHYNPAMIEVDGNLTLENIILDDSFKVSGTHYTQAGLPDSTVSSLDIVQDSIIATYDGGDQITLGQGSVLKNFGGMSAVRLSAGTLIMKNGSTITGSKKFTKADKDSGFGAAGAIWMQGGTFTMEQGAVIENVEGRAVYADGGTASLDGTIQGVISNPNIWQGGNHILHVRNSAQITLEAHGLINGSGLSGTCGANVNSGGQFTMAAGSKITSLKDGAISMNGGSVMMDGEIYGVSGGNVLNLQGGQCTIGANGAIHHNSVSRTTVYFQSDQLDLYGKIYQNYSADKSGGVEVNNNVHGEMRMYPGAEITDNYGKEQGAGVMVCRGVFTMMGGTISRNISGLQGGGVCARRGGTFIMQGGEIKENISGSVGGGVAYDYSETSYPSMYVQLQGGTISGNVMNANVTASGNTFESVSAAGGISDDLAIYGGIGTVNDYVQISPEFAIQNPDTYMTSKNFWVNLSRNTKYANAGAAAVQTLTQQTSALGFSAPIATLWAQNSNGLHAEVSGLSALDPTKPVHVFTCAVNPDGTPVSNAVSAPILAVQQGDDTVTFDLPDTGENGQAIAIVQPATVTGSLSINTDVTEITEGQTPYTIPYTFEFTPGTESGFNSESIDNVTVDIHSPLLDGPKTVELTRTGDTWTGTVELSLPAANFQADETITTTASAKVTTKAPATGYTASVQSQTLMKAKPSSGGGSGSGSGGGGGNSTSTAPIPMYRLYNPNSGEHFYTASMNERDYLIKVGWNNEGIGWYAPKRTNLPVYRLYNPNAGDHHYTMDENEKNILSTIGWKYEGISWYSMPVNKGVKVYREYNPNAKEAGAHNYTINKVENDYLISIGWLDEGIAWWAVR